jgi:hypothetical protein
MKLEIENPTNIYFGKLYPVRKEFSSKILVMERKLRSAKFFLEVMIYDTIVLSIFLNSSSLNLEFIYYFYTY